MSSNDTISYSSRLTREQHFEEFKYFDVKIYKNLIKHNKNLPHPISSKELELLEESYKIRRRIYEGNDYRTKYSEKEQIEFNYECLNLSEQLYIQRIISNPEYFEEIKEIERKLTDIELTDGEKDLINSVINHPKLDGLIDCHCINLIDGKF